MAKQKAEKMPDSALRVDGPKRINLVEQRRRQQAAKERVKPPVEDERVSQAWARDDARVKATRRHNAEAKARKLTPDGKKEGAVLLDASVRLSGTRYESRVLRAQPGTFEWRYGRKNADSALYHAGIHFATLWERAGTAAAGTPNMEFAGASQWKGIPDARVLAMDEIRAARGEIGKWGTARLVDYCVLGTPAADIARKYEADERAMAHVLNQDLRACAVHFHYL